jgi:IS5 family transposase
MKPMNQRCNPDSAQAALFTAIRWPKAATPKRCEALGIVDHAVPWGDLVALVRPHYQADAQRTGRKGYSLSMMLRAFVVQQLWHMSDRQTEAAILDSHAMASFIGTDPWAPRPPSASALRAFRALLESRTEPSGLDDLATAIRNRVVAALAAAGLEFRPGVIREPVFRRRERGRLEAPR